MNYRIEAHPDVINSTSKDINFIKLAADNISNFVNLFGLPNRKIRDSENRLLSVWNVNFEGEKFTIYSNTKRGTTYEIEYNGTYQDFFDDNEVGNKAKRFLKQLLKELK